MAEAPGAGSAFALEEEVKLQDQFSPTGEVEARVLAEVSVEKLGQHLSEIAKWQRDSGSAEEAEAFAYIRREMESYGLEVTLHQAEGLISWPGEASLQVLSPEQISVECITHAFAKETGPEGLEGEVVFVGGGSPEDFDRVDLRGRIAVVEGLGSPEKAWNAEQHGVAGLVFINDDHLHQSTLSTIWGSPTPETVHRLPKVPGVSIVRQDGERLRQLTAGGPVSVRLVTEVTTVWRPIPVLTADLLAGSDPHPFVLFAGHVDGWYHGAMDNGSANATMIEVARLLTPHRSELRRGVRWAFWSGHSHGRYAGSTWYVDHFWRELHRRCVAHVNIDSTGAMGATILSDTVTMAETKGFAGSVIADLTGQQLNYRRVNRAGDQSFWGVGLPSMFMTLSHRPVTTAPAFAAHSGVTSSSGGSGKTGWWWHGKEDTVDKLDPANMVRDTRIYASVVSRLCTAPVLPFDYAAAAREMGEHMARYQTASGDGFDLSEPIALATELASVLGQFRKEVDARVAEGRADEATCSAADAALVRLGHLLIPLNYSVVDPFDLDLAQTMSPVPILAPAARLAGLDPVSNESHFLITRLLRERNKMVAGLEDALEVARQALVWVRQ